MPYVSTWPAEHIDALKAAHADGLSFSIIAATVNERFGTRYTRNSMIGKAGRLGLTVSYPRPKNPPKPRAPRAPRLVRLRPPAQVEARPEVAAAEMAGRAKHLQLFELTASTCRFPHGKGPYTFCGHTPALGSAYCWPHTMICTQPRPNSRRVAA